MDFSKITESLNKSLEDVSVFIIDLTSGIETSDYKNYLLFALAAICNAVMDVSKFHWHKSIFSKGSFQGLTVFGYQVFKREWWDGTISWMNKYVDLDFRKGFKKVKIPALKVKGRSITKESEITKPVQLTDAFHYFKMLMVLFLCWAISDSFLEFIIYSTIWIQVFNLFYNKVLKINTDE